MIEAARIACALCLFLLWSYWIRVRDAVEDALLNQL